MVEVTVEDVGGDEHTIDIPSGLPYPVARRIQRETDLVFEQNRDGEVQMQTEELGTDTMADIQEIILDEVLPEDLDKNTLTIESVMQILNPLVEKLQGVEVKN